MKRGSERQGEEKSGEMRHEMVLSVLAERGPFKKSVCVLVMGWSALECVWCVCVCGVFECVSVCV